MASLNNIFLVFVLVASKSLANCENCDKYGILLYEDIACEPVVDEQSDCPTKYNCNFTRPRSGCSFKGRNYGFRESIASDLTYSVCNTGCRCEDVDLIICAFSDCAEYLNDPTEPECYYEYALGGCCSVGQICNATVDAKKCEVDGRTYDIGQQFYPKNTCYSCVCHENFTGEYDETTCVRKNCAAQIRFSKEINQKCAPVYYHSDYTGEVLCCPSDFVCPEDSDNIKTVNREVNNNSSLECEYGEQKLKLGEGFERQVNRNGHKINFQCECILPPLVTCKIENLEAP